MKGLLLLLLLVPVLLSQEKEEKKDGTGGCVMYAITTDKKRWHTKGYIKYPNVKLIEEHIGKFKTLPKASKECEEWLNKKMRAMPIPLTQPQPKPQGVFHAFR